VAEVGRLRSFLDDPGADNNLNKIRQCFNRRRQLTPLGGASVSDDAGAADRFSRRSFAAASPNTNLIIATSGGRVYTFDLSLNQRAPMYGIRFAYPEEERKRAETERAKQALVVSLDPERQTQRNYRYTGAGSLALQPVEIFDNGSHTFLKALNHRSSAGLTPGRHRLAHAIEKDTDRHLGCAGWTVRDTRIRIKG